MAPISRPPSKPTPGPVNRPTPVKGLRWQMLKEARQGKLVIPGTGNKRMTSREVEDIFKKRFSYGKVRSHLDTREKIRILRQMRAEDKGRPSRERRFFENRWNLKSGRDYK